MSFYKLVRFLAKIVFGIAYLPKVSGKENVPAEGAYILVCNHRRLIDPVWVGTFVKKKVTFLSKSELENVFLLSRLFKWYGAIFIKRHTADLVAIRAALKHLKNGEVLGIFPEGTRNKTSSMFALEEGVGLLALRGQVAVLPMYIAPYRLFRRQKVRFGPVVRLDDLFCGKTDSTAIAEATRRIGEAMQRVQCSLE